MIAGISREKKEAETMADFGVVIPAAGSGTRFGGDKLFCLLNGHPLLRYTVEAFCGAKTVTSVVIVTRPELISRVRELTADLPKVVSVIAGGKTRQDSVAAGVAVLPKSVDFVSVHDGARPLITPKEIDRLHAEAEKYGAVCAAAPVNDTIHIVDADGTVVGTPDRSTLMAALTPQIFPAKLYRELCASATADYTDDVGLFRAAGKSVKMILCQCENFKVTRPCDAHLAEQILQERACR